MKHIIIIFFLFLLINCGSGETKCKVDYDCEEGLLCNKATGKCETFVCKTDTDCIQPELKCENNVCIQKAK